MNFSRSLKIALAALLPCLLAMPATVWAAGPKEPSALSNPLAQAMLLIMILLALAIAILANVVNNAADMFRDKLRADRESKGGGFGVAASLTLGALLWSLTGIAQDAAAPAVGTVAETINGLSPITFYIMLGVIAVEIGILVALVYQLKFLIGLEKTRVATIAEKAEAAKPKENWWWKINKAVSVEKEQEIDLSHDYDGIHELDNKIPPWWMAAMIVSVLFAVVYLWRYHVTHSAPLMVEELQIAMKEAEIEKEAYLKKSAGNVDESTVKMLDESGVAAGKALFAANCIACHGSAGEGNAVGPNLTDKYWIHGGSISDVFKTIKYGWPEKGMRSWKDDFTPVQIAQLSSYVESLKGTNPPNAKEPQGEPFDESAAAKPDSAAPAPAPVAGMK